MRAPERKGQIGCGGRRASRAGTASAPGTGTSRPPRLLPTIENFRTDPLYPRIERAVSAILATSKIVAPVDVLVRMGMLAPGDLEDWRRGRVPYLEKVIQGNLMRLGRLLRILRMHVHDLRLVPTITVYQRHGKGPKQRLRFSKTGTPSIEAAYARHFVWPGKGPFHPPTPKKNRGREAGGGDADDDAGS